MSIASDVRKFVAEHMNDVGKFTTKDVSTMCDEKFPSSNISVALHDWATYSWIVDGYRITKDGKKGGRQTWEVVPANKTKAKDKNYEATDVFVANVLEKRADGSVLVKSGGVYYRIERLEW